MKKVLTAITVAAAFTAAVACAGCDDGSGGGGGSTGGRPLATGSSAIIINDFDWSFMRAEDYTPGMTSADGVKSKDLEADTDYYFVCDYNVGSVNDNDGQTRFDTNIKFDDVSILDGTIQEVGSGSTNEQYKLDNDTGKDRLEATVSFRIPAFADEVKHISITMRLVPVKIGTAHISINFGKKDGPDDPPKTDSGTNISGSDGLTRALDIIKATIPSPEITYNSEAGILVWRHVKNAAYYKIFVDEEPLIADNKEVVVYADEATRVGQEMSLNLVRYIAGYHRVKIQALNGNANYENSYYSNTVEVTIL